MTKHTAAARALVAAEHPIGAEVGADILARGGNAVDAAVATAFAMTVVEPFMSSMPGANRQFCLATSSRTSLTAAIKGNFY